jgi:hypothetical protein
MADLNELNSQLSDLQKQVTGLTTAISNEQNIRDLNLRVGNIPGVLLETQKISNEAKAVNADNQKIKDLQSQISQAEQVSSNPVPAIPTLTPATPTPAAPPAPSVMYSCNNYTCSVDTAGQYSSLDDCQKDCTANYECNRPKLGNPTCMEKAPNKMLKTSVDAQINSLQTQIKGLTSTISNEQKIRDLNLEVGNTPGVLIETEGISNSAKALKDLQTKLKTLQNYKLQHGGNAMIDVEDQLKRGTNSKTYKKLSECQANCKPLYKCDSDTRRCIVSSHGKFGSLSECETLCTPRFTCDIEDGWTVKIDPQGKFESSEEASINCKPPLIVPKQRINKEQLDKQKTMALNIAGDLNSGNFRLKSTWMHLFVWTAIAILFIALVFYYMSNNTDNALMTVVGIIIAIILIYIIAMWIYNHFFRNGGVKFGAHTY